MPDPITQATSDAIDAINPVPSTVPPAAEAGTDGATKDKTPPAAADDGAGAAGAAGADDGKDKGAATPPEGEAGATPPAGDGAEGAGADEPPQELTDALAKEVAELTDEEKALVVEHKDKLTDEQITTFTEAGVIEKEAEDTKPVTAEPFKDGLPKPHEVPENDDDLVLEVEDADGKKIKITTIDDLPEDFMFKDSRQVLKIADQLRDLRDTKAERTKLREENNTISNSTENRNAVVKLWKTELADMQEAGVIPAGEADFEKGKFANKAVQEGVEGIFNYMIELNSARSEKGLPLLSSLQDVLTYRQADERAKAEADADKHKKAVKTEKAKVVAGSKTSTAAPGDKDEPTYVRGSGVGINDIVNESIENLTK